LQLTDKISLGFAFVIRPIVVGFKQISPSDCAVTYSWPSKLCINIIKVVKVQQQNVDKLGNLSKIIVIGDYQP